MPIMGYELYQRIGNRLEHPLTHKGPFSPVTDRPYVRHTAHPHGYPKRILINLVGR